MGPRCLPNSQVGQIYKHHGGFRVQLWRSCTTTSTAGRKTKRVVRGPVRLGYLRARQDLARARTCPSREAMVAFVSGGCSANDENLPSDPETLRAEQTACFSSRRLCGKQTPGLSQRRIGGGKRPPCFVRQRVSVALLRPRAEAKAAPALRGDNPQEPPSRTMTGNAGAAPMVARGVAAARAETPRAEAARAEAARAEAAGAEARWQAAKTRGWAALDCPQHPIMKEVEEMQEVVARSRQRAADMLVEARQAESAQSDAADMLVEAAQEDAAQEEAAQAKAAQSEARWQAEKILALVALATTPPHRQQNLIKKNKEIKEKVRRVLKTNETIEAEATKLRIMHAG